MFSNNFQIKIFENFLLRKLHDLAPRKLAMEKENVAAEPKIWQMSDKEEEPNRKAQGVRWVYTKWSDKDLFPEAMCKYRVEGIEICPDTKRQHWQCFVILHKQQRFSEILKRDTALGGQPSYFRIAKAQPYYSSMYCKKGMRDMLMVAISRRSYSMPASR